VTHYWHHSARVMCERYGSTLHIKYSGAITVDCVHVLQRRVQPERRGVAAALERIDSALTLFYGPLAVDRLVYPEGMAPSAIIVREDQIEQQQAFCALLAQSGIIRVPFLTSQLDWAWAFVDRVAARSH
jgi:hypothetical protein